MDDQKLSQALANLQEAVKGKPRGVTRSYDKKLKRHITQRAHVEAIAEEVITVACSVPHRDEIVQALLEGCEAGAPERMVGLQADDVVHLLEQATGKAIAPVPPPVETPQADMEEASPEEAPLLAP